MKNTDPRVDSYIKKSADFAKPILSHLREVIHKACPEVTETVKWGFPHFEYKGVICSMASFKAHCAFGFWKAAVMSDPEKILKTKQSAAMGQLGRISKLNDLPSDKILIEYIKEAVKLNEAGIKTVKVKKVKKELDLPDYFVKSLKKNKKALSGFEAFSPSHKREYIEWITDAKTENTREKRMNTAIEWIAEGKSRNWKYMKK